MKNIKYIFLFILGLSVLLSCKKEEKDPVLNMGLTNKAVLTNPQDGSVFVLTQEEADSIMTTFQWTAAEYNLSNIESIKYTLQMDLADSNFKNVKGVVTSNDISYTITEGAMNKLAIAKKVPFYEPANFEFRILSYINNETNYSNAYSDVITLSITPYEEEVGYPKLYVPGDYQGWDPATAPNIYDFNGDDIYTGYIYFPEGGTYEFKFTSDPDWTHTNYGYGGEGVLDTDPDAGNLTVPDYGGYWVEVDIANLTWTYEAQNWGVIGQWLEWAEDIDMIWDVDNQYLHVTVENIPAAEDQRFKYRANDAWDINLGATDPPDGISLVPFGVDIPIPDGGTLTFILRFTTDPPTYEVIEN